ncbi:MAG: molecular chaperone HtpG [Verrucomicrobia bacterium]|nr:molecular chaperone HtpG [Verrucomicrobiota bacterium]MBS0636812.1 molecular chaperone HtpG [Verrucomicrobiota bacterium]
MTKGQLQIHSQNILPIIKKWLYSEKEIFVRELISNACDAIVKRTIVDNSASVTHRVDVRIDKEAKTVTFSDTGIGLDADEAEKYLAQIAFSGAEEFIKAYQTNDAFIGHFGLGFYSAYMVAGTVEVKSKSYKADAASILWSCDGSSEYEIIPSDRQNVGTDVILHVTSEHEEFLDEEHLLDTVRRFCLFLPYPIYVNDTLINEKEPLWLKAPASCSDQEYIDFYQALYPFEEAPLFWIHLNVDYPFHVKGILYFPRVHDNFDPNKNKIKLYSNRVFVSDDCRDVLPEYLTILNGVIDSPDIPLNVSRSYLQVDKTVKALSSHIAKKVLDALDTLKKSDLERFYKVWGDCEFIVKYGMLHDDKFAQKAKELLVWKTTKSSHVTPDASATHYYVTEEQLGSPLVELYEQKNIDVLIAKMPIDAAIMSKLEHSSSIRFKRIDSNLQEGLVDSTSGDNSALVDFVKKSLALDGVEVEAKNLTTQETAGIIVIGEEERRLRDYLARISKEKMASAPVKKTFVVNTNSPLVQAIQKMKDNELASMMVRELYDLAALGQKELSNEEMRAYITRNTKLLEKVACAI